MNPIRIFGIGSPFGDDRLGWDIIQNLQHHKKIMPLLTNLLYLEACDRPGLRLVNLMTGAKVVILIDAVKSGLTVGTIHQLYNEEIEQIYPAMSTHSIGIGYALRLARELNSLPKQIIFYGIEIKEAIFHTHYSIEIKQAIATVENTLSNLNWKNLLSE